MEPQFPQGIGQYNPPLVPQLGAEPPLQQDNGIQNIALAALQQPLLKPAPKRRGRKRKPAAKAPNDQDNAIAAPPITRIKVEEKHPDGRLVTYSLADGVQTGAHITRYPSGMTFVVDDQSVKLTFPGKFGYIYPLPEGCSGPEEAIQDLLQQIDKVQQALPAMLNPSRAASFHIKVKSFTQEFEIVADPSDTILKIKQGIERIKGFPALDQIFVHQGRRLTDDQTLADCQIGDHEAIHLILNMRGD